MLICSLSLANAQEFRPAQEQQRMSSNDVIIRVQDNKLHVLCEIDAKISKIRTLPEKEGSIIKFHLSIVIPHDSGVQFIKSTRSNQPKASQMVIVFDNGLKFSEVIGENYLNDDYFPDDYEGFMVFSVWIDPENTEEFKTLFRTMKDARYYRENAIPRTVEELHFAYKDAN